jgi:hypothetical protein
MTRNGQDIREPLEEGVTLVERTRLTRECAKLDIAEEQALADEGLAVDAGRWPEY